MIIPLRNFASKFLSIIESTLGFDPVFYTEAYEDLRGLSRVGLLFHWYKFGNKEFRLKSWDQALSKFNVLGIEAEDFDPYVYMEFNEFLADVSLKEPAQAVAHYLSKETRPDVVFRLQIPDFLHNVRRQKSSDISWDVQRKDDNYTSIYPKWDLEPSEMVCSSLEDTLKLFQSEDFLIQSFKFFHGYLPVNSYLDHLEIQLDYNFISRTKMLALLLKGSGLEVDRTGELFYNHSTVSDVSYVAEEINSDLVLMGMPIINKGKWYQKAFEQLFESKVNLSETYPNHRVDVSSSISPNNSSVQFNNNWIPTISVLCSVYKSEKYLSKFIENIRSQSAFSYTEFIIVLVEPSAFELTSYTNFAKESPNVILKVINTRIGIYEAWNIGVEISRGKYLTNMNVDDLRRNDSLEVQCKTLDRYPWVDILYQDVHMNICEDLSWRQIEKIGAVAVLPLCNSTVFMSQLNPPHNAPMWRSELHETLGLFREEFSSAGDVDFWIRCSAAKKVFFNSNDAHVSYFENPNGLSTSSDTPGLREHRQILDENIDLLRSVESSPWISKNWDQIIRTRDERISLGFISYLEHERGIQS